MMDFMSALVIVGTALIGLFFLGVMLLLGMRFFRPGHRLIRPAEEQEEARLMQELYRNMEKLDARVENLESILLRRDGRD
jgi:phage shock protein B